MDRFLDNIIEKLEYDDLAHLRDYCYVFPTRRAGLFFGRGLSEKFCDRTFWAPTVFSIREFVESCCETSATDELTLLFELHSVYQKYQKDLLFDDFFSWGQILLRDFDEVDRHMVDADLLYRNLQEVKDIDEAFADQEALLEAFRQFARVIMQNPDSLLVTEFIRTWELVRKVFVDFKSRLKYRGMAYEGMLYHDLATRLTDQTFELPYEKVVFTGFNALSRSEEIIFEQLSSRGIAEFYWDSDESYLNDVKQEAGFFLRQHQKRWPGEDQRWVVHDSGNRDKQVHIIGVPQAVGQAKATGLILKERLDEAKTAIVLADENLLFPVLYSLPEDLDQVNVSMGYPLKNSPLYSLVQDLVRLQAQKKGKGEGVYYKARNLLAILVNPFLQALDQESCSHGLAWIRRSHLNWVKYPDLKQRIGNPSIVEALRPVPDVHQALETVISFILKLNHIFYSESPTQGMDKEVLYHFVKLLKQLDQKLAEFDVGAGFGLLENIIKETIQPARVPFTGEPLVGLQILGFLETRVLDFENIIVLSINENKIPTTNIGRSYIPFALRKAFNLPTTREQDSIYAYHFFRLLQRAKNAFLLYDTEVEVDGSGEKSRFLLQLIDHYHAHPRIKVSQSVYTSPIPALNQTTPKIEIFKNPEIYRVLEKYLAGSKANSVLGPTALGNYIDCSLRFYFKYVVGLQESEPFSGEMNPREFGLVVHAVLESVLENYVGKTIDADVLTKVGLPENIRHILIQKLQEHSLIHDDQLLEGRNLLNHKIIESLVGQILDLDQNHAPFYLIAVESKEYNLELEIEPNRIVKLGGTVDRIDQKVREGKSITRIIDYKTGKIDLMPPSKAANPNIVEYLTDYFAEGKYRAGFQGYFYGFLFHKAHPEKQLVIGIFGLQEINKGIQLLRNQQIITDDLFAEFEGQLGRLLQQIWDPKIPFSQTDDESKCVFCPYATICSRK